MHSRLTAPLNSVFCKVTALLLLSIGSILFFNLHEKYAVIGPEQLRNAHFDNNLEGWKRTPYGVFAPVPAVGGILLQSGLPATSVQLDQIIPGAERFPLLRLSCDIETRNVSEGKERWMTARVVLVSYNREGKPMYNLPHTLANISGTHNWEHHEAVFAIDAKATSISVSIQLAQATGSMWVKNLSLRPVVQKDSFHKLRYAVALLWAAIILWVAVPITVSAAGNAQRTAVIALALIIAFGVLMPEALKVYIGSLLSHRVANNELLAVHSEAAQFKFTPIIITPDIFKAGHFILFAMLAAVAFSRRTYPASRARLLCYLLLFALITEILQLFVAGRGAQLSDFIIDSAGIATGLLLLWFTKFSYPPRS